MGVEVEQETSAPPPKKSPGSAPVIVRYHTLLRNFCLVPKMPFWPSLAWDNTLALRLNGITILVLLDTISKAAQLTTAAWKVLFVG